jgi:hypothetical protein
MRIACLHTLASLEPIFQAAADARGVEVTHVTRADFLLDAEKTGGMTDEIRGRVVSAILDCAERADAVLVTCSTIGQSVDAARALSSKPVFRVDAALAKQAIAANGPLTVLYAVETTLTPTRNLFEAMGASSATRYVQVPGAWDRFRAGDLAGYDQAVADFADDIFASTGGTIAFAQASMAGAVVLCSKGVPLASPGAGLDAARRV